MKIWLIRHGLTRPGEEQRYQGALDEGLSEKGRAQLRKAELAPEKVFVSPLLRARETAEILFPDAEKIPVPDLREMNFGDFEGRTWREMEHDAAYRHWVDGGCLDRCPGGESREEYSARVCRAVQALLSAEGEELVIVAHGGTQMAVLEKWGRPHRRYYEWQRPCGCGWQMEYDSACGCISGLQEVSFLT